MAIRIVIGCRSYLFSKGLKKLLDNDKNFNTIGIFTESTDLKEIVKINADCNLS